MPRLTRQAVDRNGKYGSRTRRRIGFEALEERTLLAADTGLIALDANCDGTFTPADVVTVVNGINAQAGGAVEGGIQAVSPVLDVNGDGALSAADVLPMVNRLNLEGSAVLDVVAMWGDRLSEIGQDQQENLQQLLLELNRLRRELSITPEQVAGIVEDAIALLEDASFPSEESLTQLLATFDEALADGAISLIEQIQLGLDLQSVLESANIPLDEFEALADEVRSILETGGLTEEQLQPIIDQLTVIVEELKDELDASPEQLQALHDAIVYLADQLGISDSVWDELLALFA